MLDTMTKTYRCDFCHTETCLAEDYEKLRNWEGGRQGELFPLIPYSGCVYPVILHSCPNPICKAKLLIWTRS